MQEIKHWINWASRFCLNRSLGLLLIRFALGLVFVMHGWQKIHSMPMIEGMFVHLGLGSVTGDFIAWLEVIGGGAMILGILPRIFGAAFGIEMLVAIFLTGIDKGYRAHELEIFLMLVSFGIALAGSGKYSLLKMECDDCGGMLCDRGTTCPVKS
jgi:putative oxidoreductase